MSVNPEGSAETPNPRGFAYQKTSHIPWKRLLLWVVGIVGVALLIAVLARIFLFDIYTVAQESMEPTLEAGDRIGVNKLDDSLDEISAGDVVVFDGEGSLAPYRGAPGLADLGAEMGHWLGITAQPDVYVKRVIGVAGDDIRCCAAEGLLERNGEPLEESYLGRAVSAADPASELEFSVTVPEGRIWVMGDNREKSVDSRALLGAPGGGMISEDRIIGRVDTVLWPLDADSSIND